MNVKAILILNLLNVWLSFAGSVPTKCPVNEEYLECGTACPATCNDKPTTCTLNCVQGCFCKKGYVRKDSEGPCIPEKNCETFVCPVNEEFLDCGTACPATCNSEPNTTCTANCVIGCFCKKDYVRVIPGGPCIPKRNCEDYKCKKNEIFSTCATLCPRTCNDEIIVCPLLCKLGCVCRPGFVRDRLQNGKCIPEELCKDVCNNDRVYSDCGTACPGTCSEPIKICNKKCVKGCFCREGYVLQDGTGKCVKLEECPVNCNGK